MTNPPMPNNSRTSQSGTTPFPNVLLDKLMPRVRDVEWRILCVIVRQTFGWRSGDGQPKQTDWLSHSQLKRRTGRSSAAISPAIEFLCRNDLLEVEDGRGRPLKTAYERRRHRGRLYFRLNSAVLFSDAKPVRLKKRIKKLGITINTHDKKNVVVAKKRNPSLDSKSRIERTERIRNDWRKVGDGLKGRSIPASAGDES